MDKHVQERTPEYLRLLARAKAISKREEPEMQRKRDEEDRELAETQAMFQAIYENQPSPEVMRKTILPATLQAPVSYTHLTLPTKRIV